jgi:hypothetical protein
MSSSLTEWDLRITARRLVEEGRAIADHFEFERNGGKLFWVVDTDVVTFYLDPRAKSRYADIFRRREPVQSGQAEKGLVALAAVLAEFIFSDRFHGAKIEAELGGHSAGQKMLLDPHTEELHEVLAAIGREAMRSAPVAVGLLDGTLQKELKALIDAYLTDKATSPTEFIDHVKAFIGNKLDLILPSGKLEQLKRGRDLLKNQRAVYEADCAGLHEYLSSDEATEAIDSLADRWHELIRELSPMDKGGESPRGLGRLGKGHVKGAERHGNLDLREHRDARVLAKLEYLNSRSTTPDSPKQRFIFISGHGFLLRVVREHRRFARDLAASVHILHPSIFLGNGDLFPLRPQDEHTGAEHWVRLTQVLVPLDRPARRESIGSEGDDGQVVNASSEVIEKAEIEWNRLLEFALPFLPAQSRDDKIKAIFKDLLEGKPLDALEQALYLALSELFVVMAELGLAPRRDPELAPPIRKPPPLRLAYYPEAERCIRAFVENSSAESVTIGAFLDSVKAEQEASGVEDFNYPLLVCLAVRFASLDEWHAARVLANYASSVAKVTTHEAPLVTGREAALLECYCRRIDAKKLHDLDRAEDALGEFHEALRRESDWRGSEGNRETELPRCESLAFNPQAEFPLHQIRARSEKLTLDMTRLMFDWFPSDCSEAQLLLKIAKNAGKLGQMLDDSESIRSELERVVAGFQAKNETIDAIALFVRLQLAICAAQCLILLYAIDPLQREALESSRLLKASTLILEANRTVVTCLLVSVIHCIWGSTEKRTESVARLRDYECGSPYMPHDEGRCNFFKQLAIRIAAEDRGDSGQS